MSPTKGPRWLESGWAHRVTSVDELNRAIGRISTLSPERQYVWRGQQDWRWRIGASLVRQLTADGTDLAENQVRAVEEQIIGRARDWRLGVEGAGVVPPLELLARLQHHGVPTRLLDVTSSPYTALWFACQRTPSGNRDASGALFAFDVTGLDRVPTIDASAFGTWGAIEDPLPNLLTKSQTSGNPFRVVPSVPDARMVAQEGLFITGAVPYGADASGIDGLPLLSPQPPGADRLASLFGPPDRGPGRPAQLPFVALIIPTTLKTQMRKVLATAYGRTEEVLFPDLAGFAQHLRREPRFDVPRPSKRPLRASDFVR